MTRITDRLGALETRYRRPRGRCPVCAGRPEYPLVYVNDYRPERRSQETGPCLACGWEPTTIFRIVYESAPLPEVA